jgi:hypothetical protein
MLRNLWKTHSCRPLILDFSPARCTPRTFSFSTSPKPLFFFCPETDRAPGSLSPQCVFSLLPSVPCSARRPPGRFELAHPLLLPAHGCLLCLRSTAPWWARSAPRVVVPCLASGLSSSARCSLPLALVAPSSSHIDARSIPASLSLPWIGLRRWYLIFSTHAQPAVLHRRGISLRRAELAPGPFAPP